jgi:hypothetical protein
MAKARKDYLRDADDDFIDCRVDGHNWEEQGSYMNGKEVHRVLQCQRCDSYAVVEWGKTAGTRNGRKNKYTPGYLNNTGEHFTRDELRIEKIRRTKFKGGTKEFDKVLAKIDEEMESYR